MNMAPEQTKVEQGGTLNTSKAEIHDRAGLFAGIMGFGVAMLALGISMTTPARYEDKARTQDQRILELENKLAQVMADVKSAGTEAAIAKNTVQKLEARANAERR